jgi:tetratricopeptide (TPR) repeat protein
VSEEVDWFAPTAWALRSPEFGDVGGYQDGRRRIVTMAFSPLERSEWWDETRDKWLDLLPHPHILDAIDPKTDGGVLLRYAALDWKRTSPLIDPGSPHDALTLANLPRWGLQVTDALESCFDDVLSKHWRMLFRPFVRLDLGGAARLGFLPATPSESYSPPERSRDERSLVWLAGKLLQEMVGLPVPTKASDPLALVSPILFRCLDRSPRKRYRDLAELKAAWLRAGAVHSDVRSNHALAQWQRTEAGIGWFTTGDLQTAWSELDRACALIPVSHLASFGRAECRRQLGQDFVDPAAIAARNAQSRADRSIDLRNDWQTLEPRITALEAERDFGGAIRTYHQVRDETSMHPTIFSRRAACHLRANEPGPAIDYARRALALEPDRLDALSTLVNALVAYGAHADAIEQAIRWQSLAPTDGAPRYQHAKALLALGRLPEARTQFETAIKLAPSVEAVSLKIQVELMMRRLSRVVGEQQVELVIPESLREVRDVLAGGRPQSIIEALQQPQFATDVDAQLILARALVDDAQLDRAVAVYTMLESTPRRPEALVAKGNALLRNEKLDAALAIFDVAIAEKPNDPDACDGRARTLEKLGRVGEAAAEFRRFVALATSGSDLRVRAARLWLERH